MSSHSRDYNEKSPSNETKEVKKITKLFITNMNSLIPLPEMEAKLRALFSKHGDILDLQVKENASKRYSFAFLEMKDPDIITTILEKYNGFEIQGKKLRIEYQKSNPREFSNKPFDKPKPYFKHNNYKNDKDNRNDSPHKWKNYAVKKDNQLKDGKDNKPNNEFSRREPYRKKSVSPDDRKRSKEKATTKAADISKPRANSRDKVRDHKDNKPSNTDKYEKKYSRHSSSSESSYSSHHRRDKKYSHSKNTSSRHHDDRKYPHKRDRSQSRDKKYRKDQESRYRREGRYDRNNKRTRERKKGDSSSSPSSSSSYEHRRRDDRKPDKKSKKFNKHDRSYSPYEKRSTNYK